MNCPFLCSIKRGAHSDAIPILEEITRRAPDTAEASFPTFLPLEFPLDSGTLPPHEDIRFPVSLTQLQVSFCCQKRIHRNCGRKSPAASVSV